MIALHSQELIIFTPPKCATHSLHCALEHLDGAELVFGECPLQGIKGGWHTVEIPEPLLHYRRAAAIRHPVDRVISLWFHYCRYSEPAGVMSLPEFLSILIEDRAALIPFFCRRLDQILPRPLDHWLRFERLTQDLCSLGIEPPRLPRLERSTSRGAWAGYFAALGLPMRRRLVSWLAPEAQRFHCYHLPDPGDLSGLHQQLSSSTGCRHLTAPGSA